MIREALQDFINKESLGGIMLIAASIVALVLSNSPLQDFYHHSLQLPVSIQVGTFELSKPLVLWINDGLMSIFFFLVGLELKREFLAGYLQERENIVLPGLAALGGILVPILIYFLSTLGSNSVNLQGWAIPMATDIAFAMGILAVFSKTVPKKLKIFLLTLAIIDDIAAIIVIAVFQTEAIFAPSCIVACSAILVLICFNKFKISSLTPYFMVGLILWVSVLKSGFHATLAGIILAFTIPILNQKGEQILEKLEKDLHGFVAFVVLPLFALANVGISLDVHLPDFSHPVFMGIVLGLVIGKPLGVVLFTYLGMKFCHRCSKLSHHELVIAGVLAGIGFTMSLFFASLSFTDPNLQNIARLAILVSALIVIVTSVILLVSHKRKQQRAQD